MRRLWLPILIISLVISTFCAMYVAVGAAAEAEEPHIPEGIFSESASCDKNREIINKLAEEPCPVYDMGEEPFTVSLYAPEYGDYGTYEMDYTVKRAYFSDHLPSGACEEKLSSFEGLSGGRLKEGYTFLLVDVIIKNKNEEKQMYMVNSATVSGNALLGFVGQQFKNSARLHAELYPGEPLETTLVFAVRTDKKEAYQLIINNFGYGTFNKTAACIELELENE